MYRNKQMLELCDQIAMANSNCNRGPLLPDGTRGVGCIFISKDNYVIYASNKTIPGLLTCDDTDNDIITSIHNNNNVNNCINTLHAEQEAIALAARYGYSTDKGTIFVNCYPCWNCFKIMAAAGIKTIIYKNYYLKEGENNRVEAAIKLLENTPNEIQLVKVEA
jgi:dCMP deaminase